jgi:hypothetical protein
MKVYHAANLQLNARKSSRHSHRNFFVHAVNYVNGMCAWFIKNNVESKMPLQYRTGDPVLTAQALVLGYLRYAA